MDQREWGIAPFPFFCVALPRHRFCQRGFCRLAETMIKALKFIFSSKSTNQIERLLNAFLSKRFFIKIPDSSPAVPFQIALDLRAGSLLKKKP
jgi:hypothetical protein